MRIWYVGVQHQRLIYYKLHLHRIHRCSTASPSPTLELGRPYGMRSRASEEYFDRSEASDANEVACIITKHARHLATVKETMLAVIHITARFSKEFSVVMAHCIDSEYKLL